MYYYIVGDIAVYRVNKNVIVEDIKNYYGQNTERDMSDSALEDWMLNNMDFGELNAELIGYKKEDYSKFCSWDIKDSFDETKLDKRREYII